MIVLTWNCQGINRAAAVKALKDLIRKQDLDCVQLIVPIALEVEWKGFEEGWLCTTVLGGVGGVVGCAGGLTVL